MTLIAILLVACALLGAWALWDTTVVASWEVRSSNFWLVPADPECWRTRVLRKGGAGSFNEGINQITVPRPIAGQPWALFNLDCSAYYGTVRGHLDRRPLHSADTLAGALVAKVNGSNPAQMEAGHRMYKGLLGDHYPHWVKTWVAIRRGQLRSTRLRKRHIRRVVEDMSPEGALRQRRFHGVPGRQMGKTEKMRRMFRDMPPEMKERCERMRIAGDGKISGK